VQLLPVVEGLNEMSQEMGKDVTFCLMVKNLTTCDEYGREIKKELMVQVRHQVNCFSIYQFYIKFLAG